MIISRGILLGIRNITEKFVGKIKTFFRFTRFPPKIFQFIISRGKYSGVRKTSDDNIYGAENN
jgi:hypothetical protein